MCTYDVVVHHIVGAYLTPAVGIVVKVDVRSGNVLLSNKRFMREANDTK